jgi:predicted dehydrogenase
VQHTFTDASDMLNAGVVDAVVVATPHSTHHDLVKREHDVHVLCERSFVFHRTHARELQTLARDRDLHLVVGYTYRFTRHAESARRLVREGKLGELLLVSAPFASMVEAYYRGGPDDYRDVFGFPITGPGRRTYADTALSGGGRAQTQVTHAMDMVLWVTGRRAVEAYAYMNSRDLAVDVVDGLSYRRDNGSIGTMSSTGILMPAQPQQQELRYYGTERFLVQELIPGQLSLHGNDGTVEHFDDQEELYPAGATSACLVDLVCMAGEKLAAATSAVATVEVLEVAYASVCEQAPVKVQRARAREVLRCVRGSPPRGRPAKCSLFGSKTGAVVLDERGAETLEDVIAGGSERWKQMEEASGQLVESVRSDNLMSPILRPSKIVPIGLDYRYDAAQQFDAFRDSTIWLAPGHVVEVSIERLGALRNGVAARQAVET